MCEKDSSSYLFFFPFFFFTIDKNVVHIVQKKIQKNSKKIQVSSNLRHVEVHLTYFLFFHLLFSRVDRI